MSLGLPCFLQIASLCLSLFLTLVKFVIIVLKPVSVRKIWLVGVTNIIAGTLPLFCVVAYSDQTMVDASDNTKLGLD